MAGYVGRFAPSPNGPLHSGSLATALASWLDARAHKGQWLVRMEDIDPVRCSHELGRYILHQLAALGLHPDQPVVWQSQRIRNYAIALQQLQAQQQVYPCYCSRQQILAALAQQGMSPARHEAAVYPGSCRALSDPPPTNCTLPSWRLNLTNSMASQPLQYWFDRRLGSQQQDVARTVGDFVLQSRDGMPTYQLAVVVDDGLQGVTHVVRGEDLADNTARQIVLQRALALPTPVYLHTPLVLAADGQKLSKQNGAQALDLSQPVQRLTEAARTLGLDVGSGLSPADWLAQAVKAWSIKSDGD
jgi:glutamyl-Q tRNA(Asp) synthetase